MITPSLAATTTTGARLPATAASNASGGAYNLGPADFIKLLVTQLQNQDPTQPTSNSELLTQVSQIGQLSSSDQLQSTLKSDNLQAQIGSASALIGKAVTGIDGNNKSVSGTVTSVGVAGGSVTLTLDGGGSLPIGSVATIAPAAGAAAKPN